MQLSHTAKSTSAVFDDPNLVGSAGLVPVIRLAAEAGLGDLTDQLLSVPSDKGANAGVKVTSLVAGMIAGADSIDDMALLRHGGMSRLFSRIYAPSTLGSFLRAFRFGHVRQLDAIAARFLLALAGLTSLLGRHPSAPAAAERRGYVFVDVDDIVVQVHGHAKQGAGFGYNKVRGLNALIATVTTPGSAPVIVAQRLRKGACASPRGGKRLVADAVKTSGRRLDPGTAVLVRMDSAFYGRNRVHAALAGGAAVSVTTRMDQRVKATIASIGEDAWTTIEYTDAVFDDTSGQWIFRAEVAEIDFVAFAAQPRADQVPGRLIVRRIPDFHADKHRAAGQDGLFDVWRFHAFFTTTEPAVLDTVTADKTHHGHAIIEQVHADLKNSALAHLPSGVFTANAAWLVLAVIAFNLTRAAATLAAPAATSDIARATALGRSAAPTRRTFLRPLAGLLIRASVGDEVSSRGRPLSLTVARVQVVVRLSVEQTQQTLDRYFGLMGRDEDFAVCFTADVTWLIADTGVVVEGPESVRDYIVELHSRMVDLQSREPVVGVDFVYLEGNCAVGQSSGNRVNYCIAYDMTDDHIAAIRCYGLGAV